MPEEIKEKFLDFIVSNFMVEREDIPLEQSLIDEGVIDSFGLIEIAAYIEREYNVTVSEEKMTNENFSSVTKIVNFIESEMKNK